MLPPVDDLLIQRVNFHSRPRQTDTHSVRYIGIREPTYAAARNITLINMPRFENLCQQSSPYGVPPRSLLFSLINSESMIGFLNTSPYGYLAIQDTLLWWGDQTPCMGTKDD